MRLYLIIFITFTVSFVYSQKTSILAHVIDKDAIPLNGNYIVSDTMENYIKAGLYENGSLSLELNVPLSFKLKLSAIGYHNFELRINNPPIDTNLGNITLIKKVNQLKDVIIKHERPLFEKTLDGTKVNIENSILSKSANATEVLTKIPSLNVAAGKLNVFGRGEAIVLINGKETNLETIKSLPVNDIKSIEILTNPDARYDAKGKAVVIIQLKNHIYQGYSLNLSNNLTLGIVPKYTIGKYILNAPNTSLKLKWRKLEFESYYGNEFGKNWSENNFITTTTNSKGIFKKYGYYTEDNQNTSIHNYRAGLGFNLNSRALISAEYDGLSHLFNLDVKQNGDYFDPNLNLTKIRMKNDASTRLQNHSVNINYFQKLDSLGSSLFIGTQFNRFQNNLLDRITEIITDSNNLSSQNRINDGLNVINLLATQLDYSHKGTNFGLDFGAKYSKNSNDGSIYFYSKAINEFDYKENPLMSNSTSYNESILAIYGLYKSKWNGVNYSIGMRWEHTNILGISNKLSKNLIDTSYSNFFPSLKFNFNLLPKWKVAISYSYKINRPIYQDLDPFLWYLDSLTSIQGNSSLKPEYLHQSELRLIHDKFVLRYSYTLANNVITQVMKQGSSGDNSILFTKDNIEKRTRHTIALELPLEFGNYSSYQTAAMNINQFQDSRDIYQSLVNSPQLYLYSYHSYKIPKWFTIEFTGEFYGRSFDGFTERKPYYYFSLGVSKSFLKDENLSCSLLWNDIAGTAEWAGKFNVHTFSNEYNQRFTTNYLRLSINYTIANKSSFNYKNQKINQAEFDRIKK